MTVIIPHGGPVPQLQTRIALLKGLLADMEEIARGRHPGRDILGAAPLLTGWCRTVRPVPCLTGIAKGHPGVADGRLVQTSDLWVLAPGHGYARTLNRFYALGVPAGD